MAAGAALAAVLSIGAGAAGAQSLFDALFPDRARRPAPPTVLVPPPASNSPPVRIIVTPRIGESGGVAHCVRLCDGSHFPLPRLAGTNASPIKLCDALCPAAPTRVYWGARIEDAVNAAGASYAKLASAFKYRTGLVEGCTCNGRDPFGTAPVDIGADVTLRAGDIVVTEGGLRVFVGWRSGSAEFTPLARYTGLPRELRRKLETLRVAPDYPTPARPRSAERTSPQAAGER